MGMIWNAWKSIATSIITVLQIQGLMSDKAKILEGQRLDIRSATTPTSSENLTHHTTAFPGDIQVEKVFLPLVVTAVMCVAALIFVCIFTLSLLLVVKLPNSTSHRNREISSDYETITPGVTTVAETSSSQSSADCTDLTDLTPQPDICSHIMSTHQQSAVTGLNDYADVEEPGQMCHYQQLDASLVEEHIYHSLHETNNPKEQPEGVKDLSPAGYEYEYSDTSLSSSSRASM
ncbi:hypothetical protein LDENG_00085360 [Lucifuga dentata]|nr:hypothetical protein LDENG_00085360 [Lucifuga dentata]